MGAEMVDVEVAEVEEEAEGDILKVGVWRLKVAIYRVLRQKQ